MDYELAKTIHVATVYMTLALFLLRAGLTLAASGYSSLRVLKIAPHINDTILLAAAINMLAVGSINPLEQPWLMAKIAGLLAYILLGSLALKRGRTRTIRNLSLIGALLVFAYILAVAITKSPVF